MNVLVLGSGGRESALGSALTRSRDATEVFSAPGNPGLARIGTVLDIDPSSPEAVVAAARSIDAGLVVIGPEAPLVAGVADALRADGRRVFGPSAAAARIEGSKSYAKGLMVRAGIPTGRARTFTDVEQAARFMDELGEPYVVKADGLAAGKGVVVTTDRDEAVAALRASLERGVFGDAGRAVVIEEFLDGPELSLIAFTDARTVVACEPAQDYKRLFDGDRGPNTGGMGSYSPVPACPPDLAAAIAEDIIEPMVRACAADGAPYSGAIYAGLVLTGDGPKVLEFNARFGDPETQALLPRLESDFLELCRACAEGDLEGTKLQWSPRRCVAVVLSSDGYPGSHPVGVPIEGLDAAAGREGVELFHAGTRLDNGVVRTAGGRVLAVSALGGTFAEARSRAYAAAAVIEFDGKHVRTDIGRRAEEAERTGS